tara:strand:- start:10099 stop:10992 length:894 start_codon:yes stop_codon:yes gene_type:complete
MFRILICLFFISFNVYSNENLLTIQQQIERLQREVSDLSKTVFSQNGDSSSNDSNDLVINLSAIDMRIYDLEKDVKNLTGNLEDIYFQIEDVLLTINNLEKLIVSIESKTLDTNNNTLNIEVNENSGKIKNNEENSLGSLKITSQNDNNTPNNNQSSDLLKEENNPVKLSPEKQFQLAFDNIRKKNWNEAKDLFLKFIDSNSDNQLSGSAHYWLGELYLLEKKYRDAALVFAEGYQKFPKSIKAPDMLFKLSEALYEVDKVNESCKTLDKFILDFPENKFIKNAKIQMQNYGCLSTN